MSLALTASAVADDGDAYVAKGPDQDTATVDAAAKPAIPTLAIIQVYFKLDPHLTRGVNMGDRWVSPASMKTVRQPGQSGTIEARAAGLNYRGQLMSRRLEPEWLAADSALVSVSPTRGNIVTITMQSPGQSTLTLTHGEITETLTIRSTYDEQNDLTELILSRQRPEVVIFP